MSTNINITIGGEGLLDKAKLGQQIGRELLKQKETDKVLETEAVENREKELAKQGKDANGRPLFGAGADVPRIDRRPAANRQGGNDVFGYFYCQSFDLEGESGFRIESGDGTKSYTLSYPSVSDFGDLLASRATGGVLTGGENNESQGNYFAPAYDEKGRLVGSENGGPAQLYVPDIATFFEGGSVYSLDASYRESKSAAFQVLPAGRDRAIVCVCMQTAKTATTHVRRLDRRQYRTEVLPSGYSEICLYLSSPLAYIDNDFQINVAETFHAFVVSNTELRYLGSPPSAWTNIFKDSPGYKASENLTEAYRTYGTFDNLANAFNHPACEPGNPVTGSYTLLYDKFWSGAGFSTGGAMSSYKLTNNNQVSVNLTTPSVFKTFSDYSVFVGNAPNPVTDQFIKDNLPSFAGALKWRSVDEQGTPYSYKLAPPLSWDAFLGPQIGDGFPEGWSKSGKKSEVVNSQVVWDWGSPGYCQERLTELGFSPSDFVP